MRIFDQLLTDGGCPFFHGKTLDIVPYERPANPIKNKQENKKSEPQITEKTESKKEDICEIKNEQQEEE